MQVPTSRYYGGIPTNLGLVSALPHSSFTGLINALRKPVVLPLTRAQFAALPEAERKKVKCTRFVIPGVIPATSKRRTENVTHCNLVFLDVDNGDDARRILAKQSELPDMLAPFSFAVYHTASSTPAHPRLRVVVEADAIAPEHYPTAVSTIARKLGLESVTRESNVVCQPMFVPCVFREDTQPEPFVVDNLAGRALALEDLDGDALPAASRIGTGTTATPGEVDLDHLRPPVQDVTVEVAREALAHLDPDMARPDWVKVGAALKHQFGDAGLDLWREWSEQGNKFPGDDELGHQWRSLKASPRGRPPITFATVLKLATDAGWTRATTDATVTDEDAPIEARGFATDTDASARFAAAHSDKLRFAPGIGWLCWDGKRWAVDAEGRAIELSKRSACDWVARAINSKGDPDARKRQITAALSLESGTHIKQAVKLAESDPRMVLPPSDLDVDPWLLNVRNGTLDLRSGKLREHRRDDLITKLAPVDYVAGATHPMLTRYLETVEAGTPGMAAFLARCFGAALTGDASPETLFLLQGDGGSGKTTLTEAIAGMLGDYAAKMDFTSFTISRHGRSPGAAAPDLIRLRGSRLAYASEGDKSARLDAGVVKSLTGNEPITARQLYSAQITFPQTWKLWLVSNFEPRADSDDTGIWRRLIKIRFPVVPPEKRDDAVKKTLGGDPAARSALLSWALAGCLDWQDRGGGRACLAPPDAIVKETQAYRDKQDVLGAWWGDLLATEARLSRKGHAFASSLRGHYDEWVRENGERAVNSRVFADFLRSKELKEAKGTGGARVWQGVEMGIPDTAQDLL